MTEELVVPLLALDPDLPRPAYAHPGDAGADLHCAEDFSLAPGERRLVGTGIAIALPDGYAAFLHPRSGLAARHGVTIVNTPGTVDAGYRGEIKVCLLNTDLRAAVSFRRGDRIAQLIVQPVVRAVFEPTASLPDSSRGVGGYGSTGGRWTAPTGGTAPTAPASRQSAPPGPSLAPPPGPTTIRSDPS